MTPRSRVRLIRVAPTLKFSRLISVPFHRELAQRIWSKHFSCSDRSMNSQNFFLYDLLSLLGENWCWPLLGPKGLTRGRATSNSPRANRNPCLINAFSCLKRGRGSCFAVMRSTLSLCVLRTFTRSALCGLVYFVREHSIHTKLTDSIYMSNYAVNRSETQQWSVGLKPLYPEKNPRSETEAEQELRHPWSSNRYKIK